MHLLNVSPKMLLQNGGVDFYLLESSVADDRHKLFKIYTTYLTFVTPGHMVISVTQRYVISPYLHNSLTVGKLVPHSWPLLSSHLSLIHQNNWRHRNYSSWFFKSSTKVLITFVGLIVFDDDLFHLFPGSSLDLGVSCEVQDTPKKNKTHLMLVIMLDLVENKWTNRETFE